MVCFDSDMVCIKLVLVVLVIAHQNVDGRMDSLARDGKHISIEKQLNIVVHRLESVTDQLSQVTAELSETKQKVQSLTIDLDSMNHRVKTCEMLLDISDVKRNGTLGVGRYSRIIPPTSQSVHTETNSSTYNHVAFFAAMSGHQQNMGIHQTVEFHTTITNEGNCWDSKTSLFKAPVGGLYYFSANIMSHYAEDIETELVKNAQSIVKSYNGDRGTHGVGTLSAVLNLQTGDDVWIRIYNNPQTNDGNIRIFGGRWSWFSGFLIH